MQIMPAFCHFWGLSPREFRDLSMGEYRHMRAYQDAWRRHETDLVRRLKDGR
jgi:hypothetical protein